MSAVQRFPQKSNSRVFPSHPLPGTAGDRGHGKRSLSQEGIGHVRFPSQQEVVAFQTKSKASGEWENSQDFTSGVGFFFSLLFPKPKLGTACIQTPAWGAYVQDNWEWGLACWLGNQTVPLPTTGSIRHPLRSCRALGSALRMQTGLGHLKPNARDPSSP